MCVVLFQVRAETLAALGRLVHNPLAQPVLKAVRSHQELHSHHELLRTKEGTRLRHPDLLASDTVPSRTGAAARQGAHLRPHAAGAAGGGGPAAGGATPTRKLRIVTLARGRENREG
jgi:hypothetical protein